MKKDWLIALAITGTVAVLAGCGSEAQTPPATAPDKVTSGPTADSAKLTADTVKLTTDTAGLTAECWYTEADPQPITFDVATEPTPTGFDGFNSGGCRFSKQISRVSVTLRNDDGSVHGETFFIEPPLHELSFPLRADLPSEETLELLAPGEFRREMVAIADDGDTWDITENVDAALKTVTVEPRGE